MRKFNWRIFPVLLAALSVVAVGGGARQARGAEPPGGARRGSSLGTISGAVLDGSGNPVAGALVKILRDGFNEVVKETKSGADGSFAARVTPGRYLIQALADGFTPATFSSVEVSPATELVYRFNLQPVGSGNTRPERRADRNDPKFRIRAAHARRSVFNAGDAEDETVRRVLEELEEEERASAAEEELALADEPREEERRTSRTRTQGYVETYFGSSGLPGAGAYAGLNFAVATPVNRQVQLIFAGQAGEFERLEATARVRAGTRHLISATFGGARLPTIPNLNNEETVGAKLGFVAAREDKLEQISVRAVDEWVVRDGVVVVLGLDYSKFVGGDGAFSPRLGVAFDANARTRLHASFAPGADSGARADGIEFEDGEIVFKENPGQAVAVIDGQAVLERSHRLEFGVERVLTENSTVEATAFFDTISGRGVGLLSTPLEGLTGEGGAALLDIANQQGGARGLRIVYTRRVSSRLRASAAYAFGHGQQLSPEGVTTPDQLFQGTFFQTAAAQLDASVLDGMNVRTVLRFSPRAAVFAIDPFAGRLAVYDPSLSILVTKELPNFGLPVRAQATVDARNLLDTTTHTEDGETQLTLGTLRRSLRGGISVRF